MGQITLKEGDIVKSIERYDNGNDITFYRIVLSIYKSGETVFKTIGRHSTFEPIPTIETFPQLPTRFGDWHNDRVTLPDTYDVVFSGFSTDVVIPLEQVGEIPEPIQTRIIQVLGK